jgi:hypothetical protein
MKPKFFLLLLFCTLTTLLVSAKSLPPNTGEETSTKIDITGGVIHGETKKPVNNVVVTAYLASKKEKVVMTDENGNYNFDDLKPGMYKFIFEKDGFKKVTKDKIMVRTDEAFHLNIELNEYAEFGLTPNPSNIFDFD